MPEPYRDQDDLAARQRSGQLERGDVPSDDIGAILAVGFAGVIRALIRIANAIEDHE